MTCLMKDLCSSSKYKNCKCITFLIRRWQLWTYKLLKSLFVLVCTYICFCTTLYHVMLLSKMLSTIWSKRTKYISIIHKLVERKKVVVHFRIPFIDFLQLNICYFPDRNGPLSQFIAPLSFFQCSTLFSTSMCYAKRVAFWSWTQHIIVNLISC